MRKKIRKTVINESILTFFIVMAVVLVFIAIYFLKIESNKRSMENSTICMLKHELENIGEYNDLINNKIIRDSEELKKKQKKCDSLKTLLAQNKEKLDSFSEKRDTIRTNNNQESRVDSTNIDTIRSVQGKIEDINIKIDSLGDTIKSILRTKDKYKTTRKEELRVFLSGLVENTIFDILIFEEDSFRITTNPKLSKRDSTVFLNNTGIITCGEINYRIYSQDKVFNNENIRLLGLIEEKEFDKKYKKINNRLVLVFSILILIIVCLHPFLKLSLMNEYDRLENKYFVSSIFFFFIGSGLTFITALGLLSMYNQKEMVKVQLRKMNHTLHGNFISELNELHDSLGNWISSAPMTFNNRIIAEFIQINKDGKVVYPVDSKAEKGELNFGIHNQKFFKESGKWSLTYPDTSKVQKKFMLESVFSIKDKSNYVIFSIPDNPNGGVRVLKTKFNSLMRPVVNPGFEYCLIERNGDVLFHSKKIRNTRENLIEEFHDNKYLKSALITSLECFVRINYHEKRCLSYIQPIEGSDLFLVTLANLDIVYNKISIIIYLMFLILGVLVIYFALAYGVFLTVNWLFHSWSFKKNQTSHKDDLTVFCWVKPLKENKETYKISVIKSVIFASFIVVSCFFFHTPIKLILAMAIIFQLLLFYPRPLEDKNNKSTSNRFVDRNFGLKIVYVLFLSPFIVELFILIYTSWLQEVLVIVIAIAIVLLRKKQNPSFLHQILNKLKPLKWPEPFKLKKCFFCGVFMFKVIFEIFIPIAALYLSIVSLENRIDTASHQHIIAKQYQQEYVEIRREINNNNIISINSDTLVANIFNDIFKNADNLTKVHFKNNSNNHDTIESFNLSRTAKFNPICKDEDIIYGFLRPNLNDFAYNDYRFVNKFIDFKTGHQGGKQLVGKYFLNQLPGPSNHSKNKIIISSDIPRIGLCPILIKNRLLCFVFIVLLLLPVLLLSSALIVVVFNNFCIGKKEKGFGLTDAERNITNKSNTKPRIFCVDVAQNKKCNEKYTKINFSVKRINIKKSKNNGYIIQNFDLYWMKIKDFTSLLERLFLLLKKNKNKKIVINSTVSIDKILEFYKDKLKKKPTKLNYVNRLIYNTLHRFSIEFEKAFESIGENAEDQKDLQLFWFIWSTCCDEEKLLLHDLAVDDFMNLKNVYYIKILLKKGLIERKDEEDQLFSIPDAGFKKFLRKYIINKEVKELHRSKRYKGVWSSISIPILVIVFISIGIVLFSDQDVISNINAIVASLVGLIGLSINLYNINNKTGEP